MQTVTQKLTVVVYIVGKQHGLAVVFKATGECIPLLGHNSFSPWGGLLRITGWKVTVHLNLDLHQSSEIVIAKVWAVHRPMVRLALKIKGCMEQYLIKLPRSFHGATNAALKLSAKIMSLLTTYRFLLWPRWSLLIMYMYEEGMQGFWNIEWWTTKTLHNNITEMFLNCHIFFK